MTLTLTILWTLSLIGTAILAFREGINHGRSHALRSTTPVTGRAFEDMTDDEAREGAPWLFDEQEQEDFDEFLQNMDKRDDDDFADPTNFS